MLYALATSCKELTHWKRFWCWEGLRAGGEGNDRGWEGWMASPTWWTWVWVNSGSWWWTGKPGVLRFMGSQRAGHDWVTELNWTEEKLNSLYFLQLWPWRKQKVFLLGIVYSSCVQMKQASKFVREKLMFLRRSNINASQHPIKEHDYLYSYIGNSMVLFLSL